MPDLVREVLAAYPQIYHACHLRHPRRRTSPAALSARESWILGHLGLDQPVSAGELARHLSLGPSTVSEVIKRLERLGYLVRQPARSDRRRLDLYLTPRGAEAMKAGSVLDSDRVRKLLGELAPADRSRAVRGLGLLARAARRLNARSPKRWNGGGE